MYSKLNDRFLRRPGLNSNSIPGSSFDSTSLASLSIVQTLGSAQSGRGMAHRCVPEHYGHGGCVNAIAFESSGESRIATGSDDTKICIWKAGIAKEEESTGLSMKYGLVNTIDTGHTQNIFDVAWLPQDPARLLSVAGDKTVRLYDLNTASETIQQPGHSLWNHHTSACVRVLRCHSSRVKKIETESSNLFLTCSEDGTVRQHDLRNSHTCGGSGCGPPLIRYDRMKIYSISISKARPHLLVLAGSSRYAYLHDRRMLRDEIRNDWNLEMEDGGLTQCVRRFGVGVGNGGEGEIPNSIVSVALSDTNPRDLLLSYSDEKIYLFDTDSSANEALQSPKSKRPTSSSPNSRPLKLSRSNYNDDGAADPREGMGNYERALLETIESQETSEPTHNSVAGLDNEGEELELEFEEGDTSSEEEEEEDFEEETAADSDRSTKIPLVYPKSTFEGHLNVQTVKDVAWIGDCVISGSDEGNLFIWTKEGKLIGVYKGDSNIANVYEPHPTLPILAVSGIDSDVKIFGPSFASESTNLIEFAEGIMERNKEGGGSTLTEDDTHDFMLSLARQLLARDPSAALPAGITQEMLEDEECTIM